MRKMNAMQLMDQLMHDGMVIVMNKMLIDDVDECFVVSVTHRSCEEIAGVATHRFMTTALKQAWKQAEEKWNNL